VTILQAVLLGIVQGFTEFLPVSSSGHLVLTQHLLNVNNPEIFSFDVYVHFGTLMSIFVVFWKDAYGILVALWQSLKTMQFKKAFEQDEQFRLGVAIIVGTIPAAIIGLLFRDQVKDAFSDPKLVSMNLVVTGLLLFLTRLAKPKAHKKINIASAALVGIAQAFAILPGISRSGTTMSTAIYLRITAVQAARFSFLLAIPTIGGAAFLETRHLLKEGVGIGIGPLIAGTLMAALSGYFAIRILMRIMERGKFSLFAFYCLAVGVLGIIFIS